MVGLINLIAGHTALMSENTFNLDPERLGKYNFHMIQYLPDHGEGPGFIIRSHVKLSQSQVPPEWLVICANVIKRYKFKPSFTDPMWVKAYAPAKRYVNSMF